MSRTKLSGFPEYLPAERNLELEVIDTLRRVFELHGFANIETRAVEPMDWIVRKGEIDKEVYVLKRLHDTDGDAGMGLHFDLTVPFARYVVENAGKLDFPFRRYQIQKVWRGERPQAGRFREFTQADIDIVGDGQLSTHFDVEVARVMAEALAELPIPGLTIQVNHRKILEGFYLGLGVDEPTAVMQVIDKLDKLPAGKIIELLGEVGLDETRAAQALALAEISSTDNSFVGRVEALGVEHPLLAEGLAELAEVIEGCAGVNGPVRVMADLRIARGLDYYTGTVFETRMDGYESLGSVCSGGRYDELASDGKRTFPGVGISLGVSRILAALFADGYTTSRSVPSVVLVALDSEDTRAQSNAVAAALRARGIATEVAPTPQKFGKQIRFAERRGIPYVWFASADQHDDHDGEHHVKDIRTGHQQTADPATWLPPAEDLRPQVVAPNPQPHPIQENNA